MFKKCFGHLKCHSVGNAMLCCRQHVTLELQVEWASHKATFVVLLTRGIPVDVCSHCGLQTECDTGYQQTHKPCPVWQGVCHPVLHREPARTVSSTALGLVSQCSGPRRRTCASAAMSHSQQCLVHAGSLRDLPSSLKRNKGNKLQHGAWAAKMPGLQYSDTSANEWPC